MATITGTNNNDTLTGTADNDEIFGLGGDDFINGDAGDDRMVGGAGSDQYVVDSVGDQVVEDADGVNDAIYSRLSAYTLGANVESLLFAGSVNASFTGTGNSLNNFIEGRDGDDSLFGAAGNDNLFGQSGNDQLNGGEGNDFLVGGIGSDTMIGGLGNDTYDVGQAGDIVSENFNEGLDEVATSLGSYTLPANLENLTFIGTGDATLVSNDLSNTTTGGSGNDRLSGLGGNDMLLGGGGDDLIDGGAGVDTAVFSGARDDARVVNLGGGQFRVSGADGVDTLTGVERVQFANGVFALPTELFSPMTLAVGQFGASAEAGGWGDATRYPRTLADVNGDGRADVVGFGEAGTYVALANTNGGFGAVTLASANFGASAAAGGWVNADLYPRTLADVNGDGRGDIVGFGIAGTYVSLANASGGFGEVTLATANFGASDAAGGWSNDDRYPRVLADVNGDGRADIVGFGIAGTYVSLAQAGGGFGEATLAVRQFGASAEAGGWSSDDLFPRMAADVNGDDLADIIGFGAAGTYVALADGRGGFDAVTLATRAFGANADAGGWTSDDRFPRTLADVNGDGLADIVGFGDAGVYVMPGAELVPVV